MLRITAYVAGGLLVLATLFFGLQWYASESGEVVVLHAPDASGAMVDTRLWVVDHAGSQWLRVGADGSGWYTRLRAVPTVEVTRHGERRRYASRPEPAEGQVINSLMQQKYGWADDVIAALVGGRDNSIPIRLLPVD